MLNGICTDTSDKEINISGKASFGDGSEIYIVVWADDCWANSIMCTEA